MRIMITGIAGFVGSHVARAINKKHKIYGIDNFSTGKRENLEECLQKIEQIYEIDIFSRPTVFSAFSMAKPDVVIHLAAQPSLLSSVKKPLQDAATNIMGTINVLEAAKFFKVKHFIFSSTSAVNDTPAEQVEDFGYSLAHFPQYPYGISKFAAEMYVRSIFPEHTIFRFANIYGERQVPLGENQVIPRAIKHIVNGDKFEVHSQGKHRRDFVYAGDVAAVINKAIAKKIYGTYNLCSGNSVSVMSILNRLKELSGWNKDWTLIDKEVDDRLVVYMSNEKLMKRLKDFRFTPLDVGLKNTLEWRNG